MLELTDWGRGQRTPASQSWAESLEFPDAVFSTELGVSKTEFLVDGDGFHFLIATAPHLTFPAMAKPELLNLPSHFDLEASLQDQLSNRPGHQRCMEGESELLLVLHELPLPGVPEREAWFFWKRNDGRWTQPGGPGINQLSELLGRYEAAIDHHQEALERAASAAEIFDVLRQAGPQNRSSRNLVQALEEALSFEPYDRDIRSLRDRARDMERASDLLHADARMTLEFWSAEHNEKQSRAAERLGTIAYRLLLLAGFFLPLVALGCIFGMNVNMPGFVRTLFWGIVIVGLSGGGVLLWFVGREPENGQGPLPLRSSLVRLRTLASEVQRKLGR